MQKTVHPQPFSDRTGAFSPPGLQLFFSILILMLTSSASAEPQKQQQTFESADAAVKALETALNQKTFSEIFKVFGADYKDQLIGGDRAAAQHDASQVARAIKEGWTLEDDGDDRKILIIGDDEWPFPFPLVRQDNRWYFDTSAGIDEITNRRIGANERNAIDMCKAYIRAQLDYAEKDRDGDQVLEYAQQIISTPGEKNGLYWESNDPDDISPFGPLVADARGYMKGREIGDPYRGYYFKILSRQGKQQPGGRYDYIINGNMIAGFALVSYPADYENSGIMSFVCSHQGKIYQADLGVNSDLIAGGMDVYNPVNGWSMVKDQDEAAKDQNDPAAE